MTMHAITWFEIPVTKLERAQAFYEQMLGVKLQRETIAGSLLAKFPADEAGVTGCLQLEPQPGAPSSAGTRLYLNAAPSIDAALARAVAAGGRIATPKVALPPGMGFFAHVADTEGNVVGLHAPG